MIEDQQLWWRDKERMDAWSLTYFIFSTVFFKTNINWYFTLKQKVGEPDTLKITNAS